MFSTGESLLRLQKLTRSGGYGYDSRLWGLAIDSIHGIEAVIPNKGDAKVVRYNVTQDDDSIMWVSSV